MRVVISEALWIPIPDHFANTLGVLYDPSLHEKRTSLEALGPGTEALIVRNRTQVDKGLLVAYPNLRFIGRLGVGLDNIDLKACRQNGVKVIAARGANATSVAEYVMACVLHHARFLHDSDSDIKAGVWSRDAATGTEIYAKTLGLIGVGDIGQRVAWRARAFGMNVVAYDPFVLDASYISQDLGVNLVSLPELLREADYISVHVPLTDDTTDFLDESVFDALKDNAVLINTSRGGIINEEALYRALRSKPARHAYLDVRSVEPTPKDDQLLSLANVTVTPHVAGITKESIERVGMFILEQVKRGIEGKTVQGLVQP